MNTTPEILKPRDPDQARAIGYEEDPRADGAIESELRQRMGVETGVEPQSLTITVTRGTVILEGDIDGRPARGALDAWASTIPGVKAVIDRTLLRDLQVNPLPDERREPQYDGLPEVSRPMAEAARRRGGPTG